MEEELSIAQEGGPSTTVFLSADQGAELKALLERNINSRLTSYCHQVGLQYSNVANMLGGRKKISIKTLQRLFTNAPLEVECRVEIMIRKQDTSGAIDAHCHNLEDILFLEEPEDVQEEQ